jgi:hypothetical protein
MIYKYKAETYDEINDVEITIKGVVSANSYAEAVQAMTQYFGEEYTYNLYIENTFEDVYEFSEEDR